VSARNAPLIVLLTDTLLSDDKKIDVTEIATEQRMRLRQRHFGRCRASLESKSMPCRTGSG